MFLLGVLFAAVFTSSLWWAIGSAFICALLFNFLFTEPYYSFFVYSPSDLMLLLFFAATGIVSGLITSRLQRETKLAGVLYRIASGFLSAGGTESVIKKAKELVREYAGLKSSICLGEYKPDPASKTAFAPASDSISFEIAGASGRLGRLTLLDAAPTGQQLLIIQAVCAQLGTALEREMLVADREKIRMAMEREQQRGTLLRSVAHDLRSPLTAISGAGNLLADNYFKLSDAERRKLASDISEEIVWLSDLVENILSMTRISEQKIVLHKQDEVIDDIIGEAVKHTERLLRDRIFNVELPKEVVTVPMDGKLISQVIINLLENAVRHTPSDSEISLTVHAGEVLTVSVADTGDGVPDAGLFEYFVTHGSDIVDGRLGLGLGLSICKTIVEAHGGTISVSDNTPKGSVFAFTLPMEE